MTVEQLREEIEGRPTDAATNRRFERARREITFDEIVASCEIAGAHLSPGAARRLIDRGTTTEGSLADHLLVLGYARAALTVAREHAVRPDHGRLLSVPEIQRLHLILTLPLQAVRPPTAPPGAWRRTNVPPIRAGMVTVPHWLIEFEMSALVDRIGSGPPEGLLFDWLADAYERFERIRPFVEGNGRVARLAMNLLLARCGYPPATILPAAADAYRAALGAADAGERGPLARILARAVRTNLERLASILVDEAALRPLASFASAASVDALRKAAQRGRLRTVTKGHQTLTTSAWVDAYLGGKSRAGRPTTSGRSSSMPTSTTSAAASASGPGK